MIDQLTNKQHKLLTMLAKRAGSDNPIWYNSSIFPIWGDSWKCFICNKKFIFDERLTEIDAHGRQHLIDKKLLAFI